MGTTLAAGDALLVVDVQADFVTGALAVAGAGGILPAINGYVGRFRRARLPVLASRDWHPATHGSFESRGGPWPAHCVAGTPGAKFAHGLVLGPGALVVSKGTMPDSEGYSAFERTDLERRLIEMRVRRLFVCGLATDYCVLHTVRHALRLGYHVFLLVDAIRAVDAAPGGGEAAISEMLSLGAHALCLGEILEEAHAHG